jgi:hypothetical protein
VEVLGSIKNETQKVGGKFLNKQKNYIWRQVMGKRRFDTIVIDCLFTTAGFSCHSNYLKVN